MANFFTESLRGYLDVLPLLLVFDMLLCGKKSLLKFVKKT